MEKNFKESHPRIEINIGERIVSVTCYISIKDIGYFIESKNLKSSEIVLGILNNHIDTKEKIELLKISKSDIENFIDNYVISNESLNIFYINSSLENKYDRFVEAFQLYTDDINLKMKELLKPLSELIGLPLVVNHRIEDMVLVSETSISGSITLAQKTTHAYPKAGTFVSSALVFGDLQARAHGLFDQKTWKNQFSNDIDGDQESASYNEIDYPIQVKNSGAVNERWALVFDSTEHFRVHAELRGIVGEGYISNDCQPLNTATGKPCFCLDRRGWGSGWAAGNVLRFNTEGSTGAIWAVRTTLQGPESEPYDWFTIQPRGDAR